MLVVIDDFLPLNKNIKVKNFFIEHDASTTRWFKGTLSDFVNSDSFISDCIKTASKYYDLTSMVGCEMWCHNNTRPDWHYDKDEKLWESTGQIKTPICSIVYYAVVENLNGGEFMTETEIITPKTNRLLVFSPGIRHSVKDFTGTRLAVAINPWEKTWSVNNDVSYTTS